MASQKRAWRNGMDHWKVSSFAHWVGSALLLFATACAPAQSTPIPAKPPAPAPQENITIQPTPATGTDEAKGRAALNTMFTAMGGDAWANRGDYVVEGQTSSFYKGQPIGVVEYYQFHKALPDGKSADRIELTKKRDIVQLWTPDAGYELTYKGARRLPSEQVAEYFARQPFSLMNIYRVWLKEPGLLVIYGGSSVIARREAETVTLIDSKNDSVVIDIQMDTHLPLRRTFKSRNPLYKDFDEDQEEYSDWHPVQGMPTPFVTTRYRNGEMVSQRFVRKIDFRPVDPGLFTPQAIIGKHK